jgi:hypothetical protein
MVSAIDTFSSFSQDRLAALSDRHRLLTLDCARLEKEF